MKKRGIGIATVHYPSGFAGGGDPSEAVVSVKHDGTVNVLVGSVDLGQGCMTVFCQIAAQELGVPIEHVTVRNDDTDSCPFCAGTYSSRVTYVAGNAALRAAREALQVLLREASETLGTPPEDLVVENGMVKAVDSSDRTVSIADVASNSMWVKGKSIVGRGSYGRPRVVADPETGAGRICIALAYGTTVAKVEVDTETGVVDVLRLVSAYDVGKAINPMLCEAQVEGGTAMGLGQAVLENLNPYYPSLDFQPRSFADYMLPTAKDICDVDAVLVEVPLADGPYGAKGVGEMTSNSQPAAIVNAIHDATGVWITSLPVTPEKVLRALKEQGD